MEIKPRGKNSAEAELALHNLRGDGYEPVEPSRIILGKSPTGEGWTDPITDTVFVAREARPLIEHELIHVDQYDRILDSDIEFDLIRQMEKQSLVKAENNLEGKFVQVSGLRDYARIGNIKTHLNTVSDPSYIRKLSDRQDELESEIDDQSRLLDRFNDIVESLNDQTGFNTWRDGPEYIQPIVDQYQEYTEKDIPVNRMEGEARGWEILSRLRPDNKDPKHREINEALRQTEQAYSTSEMYNGRKVRKNVEEIVYDWYDDIDELGSRLQSSLSRYSEADQ
jgi:hypothetical protein